jgi:hypothetical protein
MKYLKSLSLAAVVAALGLACFGAGSASATVLCKSLSNPCVSDYPSGTEIHIVQTGEIIIESPSGVTYEECPIQTTKGKTTSTGGLGKAVGIQVEVMTWTNCNNPINTLVQGSLEIQYTSGGNGTVTSKGAEWKWEIYTSGGLIRHDCWYTTGTGTQIGTIKGGAPATIQVNVLMKKQAGSIGCWAETRWTGNYEVTTPNPLYIAGS